jgi:hypothetical protein
MSTITTDPPSTYVETITTQSVWYTNIQRGLGYTGDRVLLIQGISGAFGVVWVFLFM